jgi:alkylation response protein AidB-like acyl-CoA dehydrogenase
VLPGGCVLTTGGRNVTVSRLGSMLDVVKGLAPQIEAAVVEIEQLRRLPTSLVRAMADAGLFRLWIPRSLGGEEADPMALLRAVEEVSRIDGQPDGVWR